MIKSLELITDWIIYPALLAFFCTIAIFSAFYITLGIKLAFDKLFAVVCERWHLGNNGATPPAPSPSVTANVQRKEVEEAVKVLEIIPAPATYKRNRNHSIVSCAICLEDLKDGELCQALPDCQHAFHSSCIKPWLIKRPNCPICRQSLPIV
ncbi:unnamed protein product [Coffea canephora]|uniref:RING-type domain-containing protein n=1 Tax=Coffea canephora TaxID=49390 RepID=A0A068TW52_COFCA|nr:unnamed protein product [Coffea canephora]